MTPPPHHHQNQPFYGAAGTFPGSAHHQPAAALPIGSHNQFIPLQVTKKRVSANKKKQETQEFYSASQTVAKHQSQKAQKQPSGQSQAQSGDVIPPHQHSTNSIQPTSSPSPGLADTVSTTTAAPHTPVRISEVSVFFCNSYNFWASDIVPAICMKYELINKSRKNNGKQILKCKTSNINSARKKKPKHRGSRVFFRHVQQHHWFLTQPKLSEKTRNNSPKSSARMEIGKKPRKRQFKERSPLHGRLGLTQDLEVGKKSSISTIR
uniref:uncharacterized protein LOC124069456 n=1 Tax=Scatophagus argus TaxID=75038 RepID=UPI001ED81E5C|nr:uncharacterized protein LOC124069456 [Scatophagus argus]